MFNRDTDVEHGAVRISFIIAAGASGVYILIGFIDIIVARHIDPCVLARRVIDRSPMLIGHIDMRAYLGLNKLKDVCLKEDLALKNGSKDLIKIVNDKRN